MADHVAAGRNGRMQVLTDHHGWPVAVSTKAIWWMVADIEPAVDSADQDPADACFKLRLANGQTLIASHDAHTRTWTVADSPWDGLAEG